MKMSQKYNSCMNDKEIPRSQSHFNLYSTDNVHVSLVFQSLFSFYTKKDKKKNKKKMNKHI